MVALRRSSNELFYYSMISFPLLILLIMHSAYLVIFSKLNIFSCAVFYTDLLLVITLNDCFKTSDHLTCSGSYGQRHNWADHNT